MQFFVSHIFSDDPIKVKQRRKTALYSFMCLSNMIAALRGCAIDNGEEMKDNAELLQIAEETNSSFLMHHVYIGQMYLNCYFRNYSSVVDFGEKYRTTRRNIGERRAIDVFHVFFEGICKLKGFAFYWEG